MLGRPPPARQQGNSEQKVVAQALSSQLLGHRGLEGLAWAPCLWEARQHGFTNLLMSVGEILSPETAAFYKQSFSGPVNT